MKRTLIFSCALIITLNVFSQRSEIGVFGGTSYYLGDLNPKKHFALPALAFGILYRYNFNPRFAYKLIASYGTLEGNDANVKFNVDRNLSFKSPVLELSNQIELNFMKYVPGNMDYPFTPYIFSGFSVFYFNPKAEYNGHTYDLQPLGTEGQGTSAYPDRQKYSLSNLAIPFGVGFKFNLSKFISIGLEWGLRKTFTDYIDDVSSTYADTKILASESGSLSAVLSDRSLPVNDQQINHTGLQRGNSKTKDWYSFAGLIITIKLKNKSKMCNIYQRSINYEQYKLYK